MDLTWNKENGTLRRQSSVSPNPRRQAGISFFRIKDCAATRAVQCEPSAELQCRARGCTPLGSYNSLAQAVNEKFGEKLCYCMELTQNVEMLLSRL